MLQCRSHEDRGEETVPSTMRNWTAFNPFSEKSKDMIYSMGNMKYFEILREHSQHTLPQLYDILAVLHIANAEHAYKVRKLNSGRCDVPSVPPYVIEKGPSHGRRHGNTERQRIYHQAHGSSRKATKKGHKSIQDRFLRCATYRQSQLNIGWTEEHCARLDEIDAEGRAYIDTAAERARRENTWILELNSSGPNGPMNQREDYKEAKKNVNVYIKKSGHAHHRLHLRKQVRSRLLGTTKVRSASTQRQAVSGTTLSQQ